MKKNAYLEGKNRVREEAIEWQREMADGGLYWSDVIAACERFETLGRRYGLLREFRENCIC